MLRVSLFKRVGMIFKLVIFIPLLKEGGGGIGLHFAVGLTNPKLTDINLGILVSPKE